MTSTHRSVSTALRPVYAGYFPRFNLDEVRSRANYLEGHRATQLNPHNITTYCELYGWDWFDRYLRLSNAQRRDLLVDVLVASGISHATAQAIAKVDRHTFVRPSLESASYLNWSIPITAGSCLSAPGIVALMCDMLPNHASGRGLEIGVGSAYHAHVVLERFAQVELVAYEASTYAAEIAIDLSGRYIKSGRLTINVRPFTSETALRGPLSFAYHTAVTNDAPLANVAVALQEGSAYIVPRALTRAEYAAEPKDEWLHRQYNTYEGYVAGGTSTAAVLAAYSAQSGCLLERRRLYGVTFVGWRDSVSPSRLPAGNQGLAELRAAYKAGRRLSKETASADSI